MNYSRLIRCERMLEAICQKLEIEIPTDENVLKLAYFKEQEFINSKVYEYGNIIGELIAHGETIDVHTPTKLEDLMLQRKEGEFWYNVVDISPGSYKLTLTSGDISRHTGILSTPSQIYRINSICGMSQSLVKPCCKGDISIGKFKGKIDLITPQVERLGEFIRTKSRCKELPLGKEWIDRILIRVKNVDVINEFVKRQSFDKLDMFWMTVYHGDNGMMLLFMENYNNHDCENFAAVPIEKGIKLLSDWLYLKAISIVGFTPQDELK